MMWTLPHQYKNYILSERWEGIWTLYLRVKDTKTRTHKDVYGVFLKQSATHYTLAQAIVTAAYLEVFLNLKIEILEFHDSIK